MTAQSFVHWRGIAKFFGASFVLHLLWENAQAPLYVGFTSFREHFLVCLKAALGDMLFMLIIYSVLAIVHKNVWWLTNAHAYTQSATWLIVIFLGIFLAVSFELWAVYIDHRWQYTETMPLIPFVDIGLTPVLQMAVIPVLTLLFTRPFSRSL